MKNPPIKLLSCKKLRRYNRTTTCFSVLRSLSDSTSKVLRSEVPITLSERPSRLVFPSVFNVPDSRKNRAVIPLSPALYHILFRMSRVSPLFLYKNYNIFFKKSEKYPKAQKVFSSRAKIFKGERRRCRDFFRDLSTRKKLLAPSGFTALFAADFSAAIKQGFQHCQDSSVLRKNRISLPPKFSTAYPFHAFFDALPGRFRFRFIRARFLHYFSKNLAYFAKKAINFYTFSVF